MRALVTLTTDFGVSDHYVGTMKGVILSRCPTAQVVDISHGVTPFNLWEGAYTIAQAAPYFPAGTVHVVVIDPGVGTARKAILAEAAGQIFIAPDNGVLSFFLTGARVHQIDKADLFLTSVSRTFHGRDVFAAVAGAIAAGTPTSQVGPAINDPVRLELTPDALGGDRWTGRVLSVDHFGNVITNIPATKLPNVRIDTEQAQISRQFNTFAAASEGEIFLYAGSSGFVEIALNQSRADRFLRLSPGDKLSYYAPQVPKHG